MTQTRFWSSVCLAVLLCAGTLVAQEEKSVSVGEVTGRVVTVPVTMTSDQDVQGFVLSVAYDTSDIMTVDVRAAGATIDNGAELVVGEILAEGFTLGVVMDFEPEYLGQVIPAGTDVLIAEAELDASAAAAVLAPGVTRVLPLELHDGLNTPPLDNILVIDGMSVGALDGLTLDHGSITVVGTGDEVRIVSAAGVSDAPVDVVVEVDNRQPVEGYVLSIAHDPAVTLESVGVAGTGAEAVGAEFVVGKVYNGDPEDHYGGTLGVVLDFEPPYNGQTLAVGTNSLAVFSYSVEEFPCEADSLTYDITFVDEAFGDPLLSNVLVQGGLSLPPDLVDGTVTFECVPPRIEGIAFYAGADTDGELTLDDYNELGCAVGAAGTEVKVGFYYTSAEAPIQGISMAVCFPPELDVADLDATGQGMVTGKQLAGTITEGINAEFTSFNADNEAGELIIGILVDSTPPVPLNHMYPPRDTLGKVISIAFAIPEEADCDSTYDITFCDGATGAGDVAISNRAAVFNESAPADTSAGDACIVVGGTAAFIRADCNSDQTVDIADPAATMSYLYLGVYDPSCLDACDSNDDGVVDLADVVNTLRFLFKLGVIPPAPGPYTPGFDPTPDIYGLDLGCDAGDPCN